MASPPELSTLRIALVALAFEDQAEMVPSSVEKMNELAAEPSTPVTTKSEVELKTMPVGEEAPEAPKGGGTVTTRGEPAGNRVPAPSYSGTAALWLCVPQRGPVRVAASPHPLTR